MSIFSDFHTFFTSLLKIFGMKQETNKDDVRARVPSRRYDRVAARYDRLIRPLERWGLQRLRAAALGELSEGVHLLEVGAGTGANFRFYPPRSRGVASEPSSEMLNIAREKRDRATKSVRLVQARAEQLPFADRAFDAACATLVFCSVASPSRGFAELRRVVRAGGTVVLLEHVRPAGVLGYVFDALNRLTVALFEDHFNRRTADEARRAGLHLVRVEKHLFGIVQIIVCRVE